MAEPKLEALAPLMAGFDGQSDKEIADALNAPAAPITRTKVRAPELLACIDRDEWVKLDEPTRSLLVLMQGAADPLPIFRQCFAEGSATRAAVEAVAVRQGTLAEATLGEGAKVTIVDVERAKRVAAGLHPDIRSPDEPEMAQLFAEKTAKEDADREKAGAKAAEAESITALLSGATRG